MRDYRSMSPCERLRYYRQRLLELALDRGNTKSILVTTFEKLVEENVRDCPEGQQDP